MLNNFLERVVSEKNLRKDHYTPDKYFFSYGTEIQKKIEIKNFNILRLPLNTFKAVKNEPFDSLIVSIPISWYCLYLF